MKFPKKLKNLIDHRGTTQADLARALDVKDARITEWLDGEGPMLIRSLILGLKMARALNVPMEYLADEEMEGIPPPVPSKWETLVREIAGRYGWEFVYWRIIEAKEDVKPIGYADPSRKDIEEAAETLARQIRKKTS